MMREKSGGFWQNDLKEHMIVAGETGRSTLVSEGQLLGLTFNEEWYVLEANADFAFVAYKGKTMQDVYEGAFVYTRSPEIPDKLKPKVKQAVEKHGYKWDKFCVIDNACPAAEDKPIKSARFDFDDLPDLLEILRPGTIARREFSGTYYK
jgi:hypothetical protein